MAIKSEITGVERVNKNFKLFAIGSTNNIFAALIKGALLVQREAQLLTPVDLGNLRASGYTVFSKNDKVPAGNNKGRFKSDGDKGDVSRLNSGHTSVVGRSKSEVKAKKDKTTGAIINPKAIVGFTAFYAQAVHEDLNVKHTVGEAKYLEKSLKRNTTKLISFINAAGKKGVN